MKAVVVTPPIFSRDKGGEGVYPPLGALCVATVANERGHRVELCDLTVARRRRVLPGRARWHEAAAHHILGTAPDLVGFGTVASSFPTSVLVCQALKRLQPSVTTVFGGPHASLVAQDLLREVPEVDFVLTGEADLTFASLLARLETRSDAPVQGLTERRRADIVHEPCRDVVELDELPIPDYGLWPFEEAIEKGWCEPLIPIDAGRGCPYECTFCSTSRFFGRRFRMKSPLRVAEEMRQLYRRYGFAWFTLTSDTFTVSRQVAEAVSHAIASSGVPGVRWACSARIDTVDRELMATMRDSGCFGIFFGVESGSRRVQRRIRKNLDVRKFGAVVKDCLDLGLSSTYSTIFGFPEEGWREVDATLDVLLRFAGIDAVLPISYVLSPQPGTALTDSSDTSVRFDGWSSDFCSSFGGVPQRERRFVARHLTLCPEFGYFRNDRVDRRELVLVVEFSSLLLYAPPGFVAFCRRVGGRPLAMLLAWLGATVRADLPLPKGNGFFRAMTVPRRSRYLRVLLDLLDADHVDTERERAFVAYFRGMLDCLTGKRNGTTPEGKRRPAITQRSSLPKGARPVLARACGFANLRHDALESIGRWRTRGQWRWPRETPVSYLFVDKRRHLSIARVARVTNLVARRCDGTHSIRDLVALVDCLEDPETTTLRASLGPRRLTAAVLSCLARSAGLVRA